MTEPLAALEDFENRLPGGISSTDTARAQAMLEDASALIRAEAGATVSAEWDADGVPDIAKTVCMSAAKRAFLNPEAVESLSLDGHAASFGNASPDVYLTKAEKSAIRRVARKSGLWVQSTTRSDSEGQSLDTPGVAGPGDGPLDWDWRIVG